MHDQSKTNFDYFSLMYPMCGLDSMLQNTNQNAVANGISQCVSKGEFLKFLGLRLAMACEPRRGPISVYWETGSEAGAVYTGADFGSRFKMSRHRFQDIQKVFSFAPPHNDVHTSDVSHAKSPHYYYSFVYSTGSLASDL